MEFKNGYRLLYQRAKDIYASKKNIPTIEDEVVDTGLTEEEKKNIKLVYEKKEGIIVNFTGLPTADDKSIELTAGGEIVVGPSGDVPSGGLLKMKGGDKFVNFHFDTTLKPVKSDFKNYMPGFVAGMEVSPMFGMDWYYDDKDGGIEELDDMVTACFFAKGTKLDSYTVEQDSFGLVLMSSGLPIYSDEGMAIVMSNMTGTHLEAGWTFGWDNLREYGSYFGERGLYGNLWEQGVEGSDYTQDWNGKFVGFKEEDYYKEPALNPIEIGQHLVNGTKIHFNTSSEDNFLSMLKSLTYEDWQNGVQKSVLASVGTDKDEERKLDWLWAMKIPKELVQTEEDVYILNLGDSDSDGHCIYLSAYVEGMSGVVVGFNNLDNNGDFTMSVSSGYYIVNGLYGSGWNGALIGMGEQPQPGPVSLTPFENGQYIKGYDFGNVQNGDINEALEAFLLSEGAEEALLVKGDGDADSLMCDIMRNDQDERVGALFTFAQGYEQNVKVLYCTWSGILNGIPVTRGYQNLENGKCIADNQYEVSYFNEELEGWNGIFVGAILGEPGPTPPTPTTTTFSNGQTIYQGDKVYVDTTKASELQSWLEANVDKDNPQVPMIYAPQSAGGQAFVLMGAYADGGYGVMAVAGQNMIMIYLSMPLVLHFSALASSRSSTPPLLGLPSRYCFHGCSPIGRLVRSICLRYI